MELKKWEATISELKSRSRLGHAMFVVLSEVKFKDATTILVNVLGIDQFDTKTVAVKEGESKLKIEAVRSWVKSLQLSARSDQGVLGVIEGADLLTVESANALLKTIEEPTRNVFILLLAKHDNLIPTIRSRVSVFNIDETEAALDVINIPDSVSGIIKLADEWQVKKNARQKLAALLSTVRSKMKSGEYSAQKVDRILDAYTYNGSGLNQKLLVEGVLIDYDK